MYNTTRIALRVSTVATRRHARSRAEKIVSRPSIALIARRTMSSSFDPQPSPPRLPAEEQAEFERLLREASESLAAAELADAVREANVKAAAAAAAKDGAEAQTATIVASAASNTSSIVLSDSTPEGTSGNPVEGVWRGAPPEFEGDRNPVTGEVGGPKNEPLRWGSNGDWSFNGRVTDF